MSYGDLMQNCVVVELSIRALLFNYIYISGKERFEIAAA